MKRLRFLSLLLVTALFTTMAGVTTFAANNGPYEEAGSPAFITFYSEKENVQIYSANKNNKTGTIKGVSFDRKTNTLTLNNVSKLYGISANMMGEDFKIAVKGTNSLMGIMVWGDGYGSNLTITGDGTLILNKDKKVDAAIDVRAESTKGLLKIEKNVTLEMYAGKGNSVIQSIGTTNDNTKQAIQIEGKTSSNLNVKQVKEKYTINEYIEALDSLDREWLCKFEKDGKIYGGRTIWDDNFEATGEYKMFEIKEDETLGTIGILVEEKVDPTKKGYKAVMEDEYNQESLKDVLALDRWKHSIAMYVDSTDNKEYGVIDKIIHDVDTNTETRQVTVYNIIEYAGYGYVAVPVKGMEELTEIPSNLVNKEKNSYYVFSYSAGGEYLKITGEKTQNVKKENLSLQKAKITSITNVKKKTALVKWKKIANAKKYQVQYSLNKKFGKAKKFKTKTITVKTTKCKLKKLKKNKKYFVRVRAVNNKKTGKWSDIKSIKIRK